MKNNNTTQVPLAQIPAAPPCLYMSIPLEVAQDEKISDGAALLFGEIYGLQRAYGHCFASDNYLMARRTKGRSTIQRQITDLCKCGHLYAVTDTEGRRELRVAERYLGTKDRADDLENRAFVIGHPKNEIIDACSSLENEMPTSSRCPKNGIHKTLESVDKNQEKKTTLSLSSRAVPHFQLSPEEMKQVKAAVRTLDDASNETTYASLFRQASERGRLDAWDVALESTQKARLKSGYMKRAPIAYFRKVLTESWQLDREFLRRQSGRQNREVQEDISERNQVTSKSIPPKPSLPAELPAPIPYFDDANEGADDEATAFDAYGGMEERFRPANPNEAVGDVRSLIAYQVDRSDQDDLSPSERATGNYRDLIASILPHRRDDLLAKARRRVEEQHSAVWSRGEDKLLCTILLTQTLRELLAQESGA